MWGKYSPLIFRKEGEFQLEADPPLAEFEGETRGFPSKERSDGSMSCLGSNLFLNHRSERIFLPAGTVL
ncbi:MAG TPA: hypothetical protein DCW86_02450 [Actinobacteria bacterium]|nr:hypothetical protein [Actinomycetota bacterium]